MKGVYLPEWDVFILYATVGRRGDPIIYIPGLSFPSILSILSVATHPDMVDRRAVLVDNLGAGQSDHPAGFSYSIADHARPGVSVDISSCLDVATALTGRSRQSQPFRPNRAIRLETPCERGVRADSISSCIQAVRVDSRRFWS